MRDSELVGQVSPAIENEALNAHSSLDSIAEVSTTETPENTPGTTEVSPNPVEAIQQEVEKAKRAPKRVGLLSIKSANSWIEDSIKTPNPKLYFHKLIAQFENTVIFASSNVGKSILAVQIAEEIARTEKILYVDLELSSKQFQLRYTNTDTNEVHVFPEKFSRAEIDPELIVGADLEQEILDSIEEAAKQGTSFFIVDNITFICNDSEKGATAGSFMMKLIRLKKKYALTIIIIAHTPKRRIIEPITQNDLAGSAKLINFFDAGIALARSAKDNNLRYLKQVKVRTGAYTHDEDNVIIMEVDKNGGFLKFEFVGYGKESDHLSKRDNGDDYDEIQEILRLQKEGNTIRKIAEAMGISSTSVHRKLKKAKQKNITLDESKENPVTSVTLVTHTEQPEQVEQAAEMSLPYKDEED